VVNPDLPQETSCLVSSFSNVSTASGVGDITFRAKGTAWKGERSAVSAGLDIRLPSGDELNFLGSGTIGFKPFVVWSYRARVSPHLFVGYEVNGNSQIADISAGKKTKLPSQLIYSGGADFWLTKRFTAAVDIIGQEVLQAPRTSSSKFTEPGACKDTSCGCTDTADPTTCVASDSDPTAFNTPKVDDPNMVSSVGSFNISHLSVGVKIKPISTLLVTANVLIRLNDAGLHSKPVPLVGISYTF
jgi:Putative MetA-pathway of phenol degradation